MALHEVLADGRSGRCLPRPGEHRGRWSRDEFRRPIPEMLHHVPSIAVAAEGLILDHRPAQDDWLRDRGRRIEAVVDLDH